MQLTNLLSQEEGGDEFFGLEGHRSGASCGDYNNDGFPDLFLTNSFKVQLWRNIGNGTFVNVTQISGFDDLNECRNTGATWLDYNNDGFPDLFLTYSFKVQLWRNLGNGTFGPVWSHFPYFCGRSPCQEEFEHVENGQRCVHHQDHGQLLAHDEHPQEL